MTPTSPARVLSWASITLKAVVLATVLQSSSETALAQCSLCRDAVASSSTETREAMNYAIIGLALTPYGVAAVAAWALSPAIRAFVRARFKRRSEVNSGDAR